jgi:uncharacterized repeat protein (TIGR03806 family)
MVAIFGLPAVAFSQGGLDRAEAIGKFLNGALPVGTPRPASGSWQLVNAFPSLTFIDPVQMLPVPGSNRLMVVEKVGRLSVFENRATASTKTVLFDLRNQVESTNDSGMLGLAFHPQFGRPESPNRHYLYVYYRFSPNDAERDRGYCRLSRFTWDPATNAINPATEFILINQYDRQNWHNGGGIFFGDDGFLWLSIGDEGGANDQYGSGQKRNLGLLAGVLRIDVDRDPARSHPIRRQPRNPATPPSGWPSSYSQGYYIPNDNPWQSPDGSQLEEFWAIGLRSPHRMTLDQPTGRVWVGDIGQNTQEEISEIRRGANLQWPYREGGVAGPLAKPSPLTGFDLPPIHSYGRATGGCVIGGYVYRGSLHPDLVGKYVFGDHNTGTIWSLQERPGQTPLISTLLTLPRHGPGPKNGLSSFAVDASGELFVLSLAGTDLDGGRIYRLDKSGTGIPEPPALLSQTGAFTDLANLVPASGVMPYGVNQALWSDGSEKQRWIAIPNDGTPNSAAERIGYSATGEWSFPRGTVLIKHFALAGRKVETRLFALGDDGQWYGVTYRWREDGGDAELLPGEALDETIEAGGQSWDWHFPSRTECFTCHTQAAQNVLGVKTRHLNGDLLYPRTGRTANQIVTLNRLGFFDPPVNETSLASVPTAVSIADESASHELRARSYLDINCSQCHRPGGPTQATFDARLTTPPFWQNMINVNPANPLGVANARIIAPGSTGRSMVHARLGSLQAGIAMPPLAKGRVDQDALQAVIDWIGRIDPATAPAGPVTGPAPLDASAPLVSGAIRGGGLEVDGPFIIDLTFSEPVTGLGLADFEVDNGSATGLSGGGRNYALTIVPGSPGPGSVGLPSDSVTDANGNANPPGPALEFQFNGTRHPGLVYEYHEGEWAALPDFDVLTPLKRGAVAGFDLGPRDREDAFAFRFLGSINVPAGGEYRFHLTSDDGSRLLIDGVVVVDHNGLHGPETRTGTRVLSAGRHDLVVEYFEFYGGETLAVEVEGSGLDRQPLPADWLEYLTTGEVINRAPVLPALPDLTSAVGAEVSRSLAAADADDDELIHTATGLPPGLNLAADTGLVSGVPVSPGIYPVTVRADDGRGGSDTATFAWIVTSGGGSTGGNLPGVNFDYFEGNFSVVPNFSALTPKLSGVVPNFDLAPRLRGDQFAFRFVSRIEIGTAGDYRFFVTSDDGSRLWINGALVVENDGLHASREASGAVSLTAGKHQIEVAFFEAWGGETLAVEMEGPGLSRRPIPSVLLTRPDGLNLPPVLGALEDQSHEIGDPVTVALTATDPDGDPVRFAAVALPDGLSLDPGTGIISGAPTGAALADVIITATDGRGGSVSGTFRWTVTDPAGGASPGVSYAYFEGEWDSLPDVSGLAPVRLGTIAGFDLSPRLRSDAFAMVFTGDLEIPAAGEWTFHLTSDDGSRLSLNGEVVVDNDGLHGPVELSATRNLAAGKHQIAVAYFEWYGGETLRVEVSGLGFPRQPIPAAWLTQSPSVGSLSLKRARTTATVAAGGEIVGAGGSTTGSEGSDAVPPASVPGLAGVYAGSLRDLDAPHAVRGGIGALTVNRRGGFSGVVTVDGQNLRLRGAFDVDGRFRGALGAAGEITLLVAATDGGPIALSGGLVTPDGTAIRLAAGRVAYQARQAPAPMAGIHTLLLSDAAGAPDYGFASVGVTTGGLVRVRGVLNDGSRLTAANWLTGGGDWFLFRNLSTRTTRAHLGGDIQFRDLPGISDFDGPLSWWKSGLAADAAAPVTTALEAIGSRFVPIAKGEDPRLLGDSGVGVLTLIGETESQGYAVSWDARNRLLVEGHRLLRGAIHPRTGILSGILVDPATGGCIGLGGILLQKQGMAAGRFHGPGGSGQLLLEPLAAESRP